ncbi:MAG: hypothetical protein LBP78_01980, partial [Acidaminococcales bacterium]|nr:hypothetical protein [Acidaminococcales bacterium]
MNIVLGIFICFRAACIRKHEKQSNKKKRFFYFCHNLYLALALFAIFLAVFAVRLAILNQAKHW